MFLLSEVYAFLWHTCPYSFLPIPEFSILNSRILNHQQHPTMPPSPLTHYAHRLFPSIHHIATTVVTPNHPLYWTYSPLFPKPITPDDISIRYVGKHLCGESTFVGLHALKQCDVLVEGWMNEHPNANRTSSDTDSTDHCFLVVNGDTIVDFAWKQMLVSDRSTSSECPYAQVLHYEYPPYFVGTYQDLRDQCMALMEWHATVYPPHEHIDSEYEYDIHRLMKRWTREVRVNPEVFEIPEDEQVLRFQCPPFYAEVKRQVEGCVRGLG